MKMRLAYGVFLPLLLTACRGMAVFETPPPEPARAVETTPLPARPTAVPESIVIEADAEELLLINLYERVNPSVVNIDVAGVVSEGDFSEFGSGSGFVIDAEGHIATNYHVVENAERIYVTFADGSVAEAELVGGDPASDLAVIKVEVEAALLHPVELGDSDQVRVGQRVVAIGNPFGLVGTMTVGIVSGVGRTLAADTFAEATGRYSNPDIIQTDASINPGNSGGPLLDSQGRVVGINSAIRTTGENRANSGVGFAVPVNTLKRVAPQLIETGRVTYPYLGISSDNNAFTMPELAAALDLPAARGVLISEVVPGGPADRAGLRGGDSRRNVRGIPVTVGGDIIVAIDGHPVDDFDHLISYLTARTEVGQVVTITFLRGAETLEVELTIGERPR